MRPYETVLIQAYPNSILTRVHDTPRPYTLSQQDVLDANENRYTFRHTLPESVKFIKL